MTFRRLVTTATSAALLALPGVAQARIAELGGDLTPLTASCPTDCQAIGTVSGFQTQVGTRKNPYRVRSYGKVVAFTIKLGKPNAEQSRFFTQLYGGPPQAQLIILRPGDRNRYRLTGSSPLYDVQPYFGSSPTFALPRPLTMRPGYVAALTVPTWAPAFAVALGNDQIWRSSRDPKACDDVRQNAAHDVRGSLRTYGCTYKTARLLYSVTYVPDPKPAR